MDSKILNFFIYIIIYKISNSNKNFIIIIYLLYLIFFRESKIKINEDFNNNNLNLNLLENIKKLSIYTKKLVTRVNLKLILIIISYLKRCKS